MTVPDPGRETFDVFGTTAVLLVAPDGPENPQAGTAAARRIADRELAAVDLACSRFRPDSELSRLNAAAGKSVRISPLFADLIAAALRAARLTNRADGWTRPIGS